MKNKIIFLVIVLFNNCNAQEESVYKTFLKDFDLLFYNGDSLSESRMNKIYETINIAKEYGYYCLELQDNIHVIETFYKEAIDKSEISRIWRIDTLFRGIDKIPISYLTIKNENNQYNNLLEIAVKEDSSLSSYKEEYLNRGVIPTEVFVLSLISNLDIKEDEVRIAFYLHIVAWFSMYSNNPLAVKCF